MNGPFLRRVTIRNYKSIAACKVDLGRLMFLVGPNGSGKSNFLDALRFVADSLRMSLDYALRERGSIREVRRRSGGHPNHFSLRLDFELPDRATGHYAFRVGAQSLGGYEVQSEECCVQPVLGSKAWFSVKGGAVMDASFPVRPASIADRLYLVATSGMPEFRPLFDALSRIEVYNLNPRAIAAMQRPDPGEVLRRDGSNAASILHQLSEAQRRHICESLARIVPGIVDIEYKTLGPQETIEFRQSVKGQEHAWHFPAESMSDGTLRALGVLLAIAQANGEATGRPKPLMVGLEEPEIALHPAAARMLLGALRDGARRCQILVTSHSPDLLDNADIGIDELLSVDLVPSGTRIGKVDRAGKDVMRDGLFTAGELLRQNQLAPDEDTLADVRHDRQLDMFELDRRG